MSVAPVVGALAGAGGVGAVAAAGVTNVPLPPCPLRTLTGVTCPGCGAGRCITALLDGDVGAAFTYNALVPLAVILMLWAAVATVGRRRGIALWDPLQARHASRIVAGVLLAFWVLRLLPWGPGRWLDT